MKKVLIIAYYWGTRIPGLVKYLPELGWQPILLTTRLPSDAHPPPELKIIDTPQHDTLSFWEKLFKLNRSEDAKSQVKKRLGLSSKNTMLDFIITSIGGITNYPDADKRWKPLAVKAADEFLRNERPDVLLSSSPPITTHLIAHELKNKHRIPWLADFRDPWSQNHNYTYGPLRKALDKRLEMKTLRPADSISTVSQTWADNLSALHGGKAAYLINNGFDPETENSSPAKPTGKFSITYTGSIYTGKQDPTRLFDALRALLSDGTIDRNEVTVRFYGPKVAWLDGEIEHYGLSSCVKQYGTVPHPTAIARQRESQLLLLLDWDDPREKGVYTGKIYEYLGTRRPILAIGGADDDVVAKLLKQTKAGTQASTVEDIKRALKKLYRDYKSKGSLAYDGIDSEINKYNHREMARKFSESFNRLAPR